MQQPAGQQPVAPIQSQLGVSGMAVEEVDAAQRAINAERETRTCKFGEVYHKGDCVPTWDFTAHQSIKPHVGSIREFGPLHHREELAVLSRLMALLPEEVWDIESTCCLGSVNDRQRLVLQYPKDESKIRNGVTRYPAYEYFKDLLHPIMRDVIMRYQYNPKDTFVQRIVLERTNNRKALSNVMEKMQLTMGSSAEGHSFRIPILSNPDFYFAQKVSKAVGELLLKQTSTVADRLYMDGQMKTHFAYGYAYEVDESHLSFQNQNYGKNPCVTLIFELFTDKERSGYNMEKQIGYTKVSWFADFETNFTKRFLWQRLRKVAER